MKKQRKTVPVQLLRLNDGALPWLPKNPRSWSKEDLDKTVKSIDEDPDFLDDRPVLAVTDPATAPELADILVVFGGNLRTSAAKWLKLEKVPVVVYQPETDEDRDTIKRRAMKDNGSLGSWDFDALANEWDDLPLADWGVPAWESEGAGSQGAPAEPPAQEDDFDENEDEIHVRCKKGDTWELGEHRLVCGDSVDLQVVKSLMGGGVS